MTSLWLAGAAPVQDDPWVPGAVVEDVVVGAGLTGLLTGLLLARAGRDVVVVEAREAGAVTTGNTTAKLSLLQGTQLSRIRRFHSAAAVEAYVEANREGQAWLLRYCDDRGIDYQERSAYSYANTAAGTTALRTEFELAEQAGLAVSWVDQSSELPFPIHGGVALPGQAQFDPMDVVRALADDFRAEGGRLHTGVRATGVQVDQRCVLETELGELGAERIVLATGMPILDRGLHFAKLEPERSYLVSYAGVVDPPRGMYLSVDQPSRSLRTATGPDGSEQLLVGGNGHVVGRATSEQQKVDDLRRWAAEHFPGATETHWWSAQDYRPVDALPVVGALPRGGGRVFVATGYSKWGMTNAVAAAVQLSSELLGSPKSWAAPLMRGVAAPTALAESIKINASVGVHLATGWVAALARTCPAVVPEGSGCVGRSGARLVATSTVDGISRPVAPECTHLGGIVHWNDAEKTWDCPLHGSRFAPDGQVLEGPATAPLAQG